MITPIEISPSSVSGQIKVSRIPQGGRKQLVFRLNDDSGAPVDLKAEPLNLPAPVADWAPQRSATGANVSIRLRSATAGGGGIPSPLSLYGVLIPIIEPDRPNAAGNPSVALARSAFEGTTKIDVQGTMLDETGFVAFQIEGTDTKCAGIYEAYIERYIINGDVTQGTATGYRIDTWPVLLAIEPPALALLDTNGTGPLLLPEIRLAILDIDNQSSGAPFSNLLDDTEFTDLDLVFAQRRVIQMWNETPPPVCRYTTQNFPYRYWWLEATVAELMKMSAARYRRNRLAYQAGGIAIDDQSKADEYEKIAQGKMQQFVNWMMSEKVRINMNACWSVGL